MAPRERIVGAGLAGLIAAHAWPRAVVLEAAPSPVQHHRALLRFRSEAVSALVGVPFRRVRVRKSVWDDARHHPAADIRTANLYSQKVLGAAIADRSIWSTEPVDRWVAPENLYDRLIDAVSSRVLWGAKFDGDVAADRELASSPIISTAPLPITAVALGLSFDLEFKRAPIVVWRFRVPNADLFQTVYFPSPDHSAYRASITGDLLIVEHAGGQVHGPWLENVMMAFGLTGATHIDEVKQQYGKIANVNDAARKALLFQLTTAHGVYSLGRFATWRNILLDDVVHDIGVVKGLIEGGSHYDMRRLGAARGQ